MASIVRAAAPELRRRARRAGVAGQIGRWARPVVATAAAVILGASATLVWTTDRGAPGPGPAGGGVDAPGTAAVERQGGTTADLETAVYPEQVGPWMQGGEDPTVEEIVFSASVAQERP